MAPVSVVPAQTIDLYRNNTHTKHRALFQMFGIFDARTTGTTPPPIYRIGGVFRCLFRRVFQKRVLHWNLERLLPVYGASDFLRAALN